MLVWNLQDPNLDALRLDVDACNTPQNTALGLSRINAFLYCKVNLWRKILKVQALVNPH
jgi:hypothetical protein